MATSTTEQGGERADAVLAAERRENERRGTVRRAVDRLFGIAFDFGSAAMAFTSPGGRFLRVNPAFSEMMGRSERELYRLGLEDMIHPDDVDTDRSALQELALGVRDNYQAESRYLQPDGTSICALLNATLVRNDQDEPEGFFAQIVDLTTTNARDRALQESNDRLRVLAEEAEDFAIFRIRFVPELACEYMSSGALALTGRTAQDFYAHPDLLRQVLHRDDVERIAQRLASPDRSPRPTTVRLVHPDGKQISVSWRDSLVLDPAGAVVGIEGMAYDITPRLRAEATLRESERRFRSLVQNASELICLISPEGLFSYVSPSIDMLGYTPEELEGHDVGRIRHPDDEAGVTEAQRALGPGEQAAIYFRARNSQGAWRHMEGVTTNLVEDPAVRAFVLNARDVTDSDRLRDELELRANFDDLTGLPNSANFADQLAASIAGRGGEPAPLAVVVVGLDGFASVIEVFGYERADELLRQCALRLRSMLGPERCLARIGPETFAVLVDEAGPDGDVAEFARTLLGAFDGPFSAGDDPFQLDASIGVAVFPGNGRDPGALMRRAERARRVAQERSSGFVVYSDRLIDTTAEHLSLLGQLRNAIAAGQLELHYQPQLHLATGTVRGVEALLRWRHPDLGFVAPNRFIPLAEQSGLIKPLTLWVIDAAMRQSREWRDQGVDLAVSVNVTPRSLQDPAFPEQVAAIRKIWDIPNAGLWLELTERAVMTDPEAAANACRRIVDSGVALSLDDFGTGQSSLQYLASLPMSEVKIDISFVRHMASDAKSMVIVRTIIDLAHHLGQTALAEGVEDEATMKLLADLGCDAIQGYHLCRPMAPDSFLRWLRDAPPHYYRGSEA